MSKPASDIGKRSVKIKEPPLLYCSFCGKSQHQIRKLIAGPTVFICDECVDLCMDIVQKEAAPQGQNAGSFVRYALEIRFDRPFSAAEVKLLPTIVQAIEGVYPDCRISVSSLRMQKDGGVLHLYFDSPVQISSSDVAKLEIEVQELSRQLKIAQERYLAEKHEKQRLETLYKELLDDVFPLLVEELRKKGKIGGLNTKTLLVLFADVAGFSTMNSEERSHKLDLMRLIGRSILKSEKGMYLNTWGDGVVAAFEDPTQGLRCACKFVTHLSVDGIDVRVGVNWGAARIVFNEINQRLDIDGQSVNEGARIEPLAAAGEVLCSDIVLGLEELDRSDFILVEREVELKKAVGDKKAGDTIKVHSVKYYPNK